MSFYKADRSLVIEDSLEAENTPKKLRYVIDDKGNGYWIKPVPPLSIDFDEDIDY